MSAQVISLAARRAACPALRLVEPAADHASIVRAIAPWDGQQVRVIATGELWEVLGWCPGTRKLVLQRTLGAHTYWRQHDAAELTIVSQEGGDGSPCDVA